jgi:hypothetical protein
MHREPSTVSPDHLARTQFQMLRDLGDAMHLGPDEHRRALNLSDHDWQAWNSFVAGRSSLPCCPPLAEMLRRIGQCAFSLAIVGELRGGLQNR